MIILNGSISGVLEVVGAFVWFELIKQLADTVPQIVNGSLACLAQKMLELCEDLFNGIEVG